MWSFLRSVTVAKIRGIKRKPNIRAELLLAVRAQGYFNLCLTQINQSAQENIQLKFLLTT
jgi:hypothetical protein